MLKATPWLALAVPALCAPGPLDPSAPVPSTTQVVHFSFVNGSALVPLQPSALAPSAAGTARVRAEEGRMKLHAHFRNLEPAYKLGPEYLTYVLWAIAPSGRATNLGEVVAVRGKAHVEALTNLQTFGLVVSAEPHYAVTRVSHAVVLDAGPAPAAGPSEEVGFERMGWGTYKEVSGPAPMKPDRFVSPYVFQARNALRIARMEQAPAYAAADYRKAEEHLIRTEASRDLWRKEAVVGARLATQQAEEARFLAAAHKQAHALAMEREHTEEALAQARAAQAKAEFDQAAAARVASSAQSREQAASEAARKATEAQLAVRRKLLERMGTLLRTQETPEGVKATLTDVAFPSGRSVLAAPAKVNLAKVAGILLAYPGLKVKILGHTDATGGPAFNARLSKARAEAVRRFLAEQGLPYANLEAQGLASSQPLAPNGSAHGRKRNRRVDLIVRGEPIGI